MKPVAVIPARGGSRRLPRKNVLPFRGRPLITWPICAALNSGLFSRVIVSTEDPEIASIATRHGAEVIERPASIATDTSTVVEVCLHALEMLRLEGGIPDMLCCIYATAALLKPDDLVQSHAWLTGDGFDSVMGVAEYDLSPLQALVRKGDHWELLFPEYRSIQSQGYPELVCSAGMMYWIKSRSLIDHGTFYTAKMGIQKIPRSRLCDINTREDFEAVEARSVLLGELWSG
jgi:N-acylneuraminate cytidylyltransferase